MKKDKEVIEDIAGELREAMALEKCRRCICMDMTLNAMKSGLSGRTEAELTELRLMVEGLIDDMEDAEFECLGCEHCYPAVAMDIFNSRFAHLSHEGSSPAGD